MEDLIYMINTVGFPIIACFYMAKREEKLTTIINEVVYELKFLRGEIEDIKEGVKSIE